MYGLVGKHLKHSFSKTIHHNLGNLEYELYETTDIKMFLLEHDIDGINVTIPYKTEIIPYLDELDDIAKETNSVNTIVKQNGRLIGYNTDYYGLKEAFSFHSINIENKKVLLLGNGSVSKTVKKVLNDLKVNTIITLCRTIKNTHDVLFEQYNDYLNFDIIINTTPVGMYPNNDDSVLIEVSKFNNLEFVVDLVYNPLRTKLLIEAQRLNIKTMNGLYMLVMQAKKAHELFFNVVLPLNVINNLYRKIYSSYLNYVFVGLPLSGKTKYANMIGGLLTKTVYDIDKYIENKYQTTIPEIFESSGEQQFRTYESETVNELYKLHNTTISTGGGLIENEKNMDLLKQNGIIIFLNKNPEVIAKKNIYGRPLLKDPKDILVLAKKRTPLYLRHSDIIIDINLTTEAHINEIKEKIDEYISR